MKAIILKPSWLSLYLILIIPVSFTKAIAQNQTPEITQLIPDTLSLQDWLQDGERQYAQGQDLYLVIDGGAEIYHEYGFKQAVFLTLVNKNKKRINLEIFEMVNPLSAYGIYTFKTDTGGITVEIGEDGWLSSYYLNFWKGNYQVTIVGLDNSQETAQGLLKIANSVAKNIPMTSYRPDLIKSLPPKGLLPNGSTYFKGSLALFNLYNFQTNHIFDFREGVHGIYESYSLFLFACDHADDAARQINSALKKLKESNKYRELKDPSNLYKFSDESGHVFSMQAYKNYIIIVISGLELEFGPVFKEIEQHINTM